MMALPRQSGERSRNADARDFLLHNGGYGTAGQDHDAQLPDLPSPEPGYARRGSRPFEST